MRAALKVYCQIKLCFSTSSFELFGSDLRYCKAEMIHARQLAASIYPGLRENHNLNIICFSKYVLGRKIVLCAFNVYDSEWLSLSVAFQTLKPRQQILNQVACHQGLQSITQSLTIWIGFDTKMTSKVFVICWKQEIQLFWKVE